MDAMTLQKLKKNAELLGKLGTKKDKELAEEFGCAVSFITKLRRSQNIKAFRIRKFPEGIEKVAGKMSDEQAAEKLNTYLQNVWRYRILYGIKAYGRHANEGSKARNMQIVKEYEELGTLQKVADKYGITRERVRQILNSCGYTKRLHGMKGN